jgi:DNA-binding response OmpR family regulator
MAIKDILIVDDEKDLCEVLMAMLTDEGYQCIEACNGLEAIKVFESRSVDLLITDFRMPRLNGVELLNWVRSKGLHIPVIFVTANVELIPEEINALGDCCAELLYKPLGMEELFKAIADAQVRSHNRDCCIKEQKHPNLAGSSDTISSYC